MLKPERLPEQHNHNHNHLDPKTAELLATISQDARDAARYRKLRAQHWNDGELAVVLNPKQNLRLGAFCPSGGLLDEYVDKLPDPNRKDNT